MTEFCVVCVVIVGADLCNVVFPAKGVCWYGAVLFLYVRCVAARDPIKKFILTNVQTGNAEKVGEISN